MERGIDRTDGSGPLKMTSHPAGVTRRRFLLQTARTVAAGGLLQVYAPPAPAATSRKTLTVAFWDENKGYEGFANMRYYVTKHGIGEPLIRVGFDRKLELRLATSFEPVDPTTWRFVLRDGVTFHNGKRLDAQALKDGLERAASQKGVPTGVEGLTVQVDRPSSGRIRTKAPVPYLRALLAAMPVLDATSFEADGTIARPVGTGPFKHVEYRSGDRRVFEAHERYWGGKPKIDEVHWRFVTNSQTRANMVRSRDVDVAANLGPSEAIALKSAPGITLHTMPLASIRALWPNTLRGPMSDVRVRRAVAHAVDREAIVRTAIEGIGQAQATFFRADFPWGNRDLKAPAHDLGRARALLSDAGHGGPTPLSVTLLTYPDRPELALIGQVLQQQLRPVGIDLKLDVQAYTVVETKILKEKSHDLYLGVLSPLAVFDPIPALERSFTTSGPYNLSAYALDDLVRRAATTTSDDARYEQIRHIEKRIVEDDVATIVISNLTISDGVLNDVIGWRMHPLDADALTGTLDKRT